MEMKNVTEISLTKTAFFAAPRETVWAFLTKKDKLAQWFHPAEEDLGLGKPYALVEPDETGKSAPLCWGTVEQWDPPSRLVYSFTVKPLDGAMTRVEWTLESVPGGTRLTLEHSGLPRSEAALGLVMALDRGWDEHLASLRKAA